MLSVCVHLNEQFAPLEFVYQIGLLVERIILRLCVSTCHFLKNLSNSFLKFKSIIKSISVFCNYPRGFGVLGFWGFGDWDW